MYFSSKWMSTVTDSSEQSVATAALEMRTWVMILWKEATQSALVITARLWGDNCRRMTGWRYMWICTSSSCFINEAFRTLKNFSTLFIFILKLRHLILNGHYQVSCGEWFSIPDIHVFTIVTRYVVALFYDTVLRQLEKIKKFFLDARSLCICWRITQVTYTFADTCILFKCSVFRQVKAVVQPHQCNHLSSMHWVYSYKFSPVNGILQSSFLLFSPI